MSIINQSINPSGQPAFPLKGVTKQDSRQQHVQMALPLHGTSSLTAYQSSSMKNSPVTISNRESTQGQSLSVVSDAATSTVTDFDTDTHNDTLDGSTSSICNLSHPLHFQPFTPSFMQSLMENDQFSTLEDASKEDDQNSSKPRDVLVISVLSAVKLEDGQIDLISRKMQRLTGFRNLRLENTIDPSLIAGFVINYCDYMPQCIDLSVKGQLAYLAARLDRKSANRVGDSQTA